MSLLEPEKQSTGLYINPIFDVQQSWCWSVDTFPSTLWSRISSSGATWDVYFGGGRTCTATASAASSTCMRFVPDNDVGDFVI
jgi:hypothetical protein